jgi:hypothetical protein
MCFSIMINGSGRWPCEVRDLVFLDPVATAPGSDYEQWLKEMAL